uniref:Uncharacterized protein n=1 Tax=Anguilla anguilla TaxID=7936 RepID=A0A0E9WY37_ANGAN
MCDCEYRESSGKGILLSTVSSSISTAIIRVFKIKENITGIIAAKHTV